MTDAKMFLDDARHAVPPAIRMLPSAEWGALPFAARASDRLVATRIAASEVRAEPEREKTAPLASMTPEIDGVIGRIGKLVQRLAS